jgi:probable selenium-dependent hydroxylase accessory protein YqeC
VLLVECDGARRLPMKAPRPWEPVVPRTAAAVFALMGASAFGRPICAATCYNPEGALQILGIASGVFDAHALAVLASDPRGYRKGVPPGAAFCLVVNQGDITAGREIASALLRELSALHGITGALLSWQEQAVYETTGAGKAARC